MAAKDQFAGPAHGVRTDDAGRTIVLCMHSCVIDEIVEPSKLRAGPFRGLRPLGALCVTG